MSTSARRHQTVRKILASLAVIGAAAAVAGLGTYGAFTDRTPALTTTVQTATLGLDLVQPSGAVPIPASVSNFVPGDSMTRAVDLVNTGAPALSSVRLAITAGTSNLLTTDTVNGLRLSVRTCSAAWTQGGTSSAPTYSCPGTESTLHDGPISGTYTLSSPASLAPQGRDHFVFAISLPTSADNRFQRLSSTVNLTFTGTQVAGQAR
ncbi:TasA family protein [Geodermatophilus sp. SYSU D00742]